MRSIRYPLAVLCLLLSCSVAWASSYQLGPVPEWVVPRVVTVKPGHAATGSDITYLLRMDQISLMGKRPQHYFRRVLRLKNANAVQDWSTLNLTFHPEYQTLLIHHVRVYRNGRWWDRLSSARIRELQRGDGSDDGLVDNKHTVNIVLGDIRAGDVLDIAYSRVGSNPVFGGYFVSRMGVDSDAPVKHREIRLLYPDSRTLHVGVHGSALRHRRTVRHRHVDELWQADNLPAYSYDDDTPDWYVASGWLDVSEFADWAAVKHWARPLYAAHPRAPAVQSLVQRWKKAHPGDMAAQALAALRFVQDDIRYTGIEIGKGSYRPRAPSEVLRTRYGDCKDKVVLLVSLWRAQGLHAWPALVSSWQRGHLGGDLPSPLAFDHVIAHLDWHGSRWLDATVQSQGGDLEHTAQARMGRALVVGDGSGTLTPIPDPLPRRILVDISEKLDLRKPDGRLAKSGTLQIHTLYRGVEADIIRRSLAGENREDTSKQYLNYLSGYFDHVQSTAPLKVVDDRAANEVRVTEQYRLSKLWPKSDTSNDRKQDFWLNVLAGYMQRPKAIHRVAPYDFGRFRFMRERLDVSLDDGWKASSDRTNLKNKWMALRGHITLRHGRMKLEATYRTLKRDVSAGAMAAFDSGMRKARDGLEYVLTIHAPSPSGSARSFHLPDRAFNDARWVWMLALVVAMTVLVFVLKRYGGSHPLLAVTWRPREVAREVEDMYGDGWNFVLLGVAALITRAFPDDHHARLMHMQGAEIFVFLLVVAAITAGVQMLLCGPLAWFARICGARISWARMRELAAWSTVPQWLLIPPMILLYALFGKDALVVKGGALAKDISILLLGMFTVAMALWSLVLLVRMLSEVTGVRVRRAVAILVGYGLIFVALVLALVLPFR